MVWVGADDGSPSGLAGSSAAAPIWRAAMQAVAGRAGPAPERPRTVVERHVQPSTGLLVSASRRDGRPELFLRGKLPPRRRLLARDEPVRPID